MDSSRRDRPTESLEADRLSASKLTNHVSTTLYDYANHSFISRTRCFSFLDIFFFGVSSKTIYPITVDRRYFLFNYSYYYLGRRSTGERGGLYITTNLWEQGHPGRPLLRATGAHKTRLSSFLERRDEMAEAWTQAGRVGEGKDLR